MTDRSADHRLVTYGTLAPGQPNHHQLEGLSGAWMTGTVHGHLKEEGWGAAQGYPGIVLDEQGPEVEVHVFESDDLPDHWARLDAFEGEGYQRLPVGVLTDDGEILGSIYALAGSDTP